MNWLGSARYPPICVPADGMMMAVQSPQIG